jgi:hypothetical protein
LQAPIWTALDVRFVSLYLGPDDSRDGRSSLFLKDPSVVGQAMAISELAAEWRVATPV